MSEPWKKYGKPWEKYNAPADTSQVQQSKQESGVSTPNPLTNTPELLKPFMQGVLSLSQKNDENQKYFNQGDPLAGTFGSLNLGAQGAFELTGVPTALRATRMWGGSVGRFASEGLEGVMDIPRQLFRGTADLATEGLRQVGVPVDAFDKSIGNYISPEAQKEIGSTADMASAIAGGAVAMKVFPKALTSVSNMQDRMGEISDAKSAKNYEIARSKTKEVLPPSVAKSQAGKAARWDENFKKAAPYLKESIKEIGFSKKEPSSYYEQAQNMINDSYEKAYNEARYPVNQISNVKVDVRPVIDEVMGQLKSEMSLTDPVRVEKIRNFLESSYGQDLTMGQLYDHIQRKNAELRSTYESNPQKQAAVTNDPDITFATMKATEKLREIMFDKLDEFGVEGTPELRQAVGGISQLKTLIDGLAEKNRRLDQRSIWQTGYNSPLRKGLLAGALTKIFGASTGASLAVEAGVTGAEAFKGYRGKPSQAIKSAFEALTKTNIEKPPSPELPEQRRLMIPQQRFGDVGDIPNPTPNGMADPYRQPIIAGSGQKMLPPHMIKWNNDVGTSQAYPPNVNTPENLTRLSSGQRLLPPAIKFHSGGSVIATDINAPFHLDEILTAKNLISRWGSVLGNGFRAKIIKELGSKYATATDYQLLDAYQNSKFGGLAPQDEAPGSAGRGQRTEETIQKLNADALARQRWRKKNGK